MATANEQEGKVAAAATSSPIPAATPDTKLPAAVDQVPKELLEPVLTKAAALAKVGRDQLAIVRAEAVVWSDGSLGCPEPDMHYTQALVEGYWVVINAAGQTYDFRMARGGSFQLCPEGRGRAPSVAETR